MLVFLQKRFNQSMGPLKLSLSDTNVFKGIAILMLLCHHSLGGWHPIDDILIRGNGLVTTFAGFCRSCVAIFVFLSGYGLATVANKQGGVGNLWKFYRRRYVKLMMNYWLIWVIFVPIGVFLIGRSFQDVYGTNIVVKAILDFFGVFYLVTGNMQGYNATWWFYSCIIVLYALFPLFYKYRNFWLFIIPITIVIAFIAPKVPVIQTCGSYLLVFFCGISLTEINLPPRHFTIIHKSLCFVAFMIICFYRLFVGDASLWDAAIVCTGVALYKMFVLPNFATRSLEFMGKHSFNIFLFHTFFHYYYFTNFIYWSSNPLLIWLTLLGVSILVSILIEKFKDLIKFNRLQSFLIGSN